MGIYVINEENTAYYKIGLTNGKPENRLNELQVGNPRKLKLVKFYKNQPNSYESILHQKYRKYAVRGEWFYLPSQIVEEDFNSEYKPTEEFDLHITQVQNIYTLAQIEDNLQIEVWGLENRLEKIKLHNIAEQEQSHEGFGGRRDAMCYVIEQRGSIQNNFIYLKYFLYYLHALSEEDTPSFVSTKIPKHNKFSLSFSEILSGFKVSTWYTTYSESKCEYDNEANDDVLRYILHILGLLYVNVENESRIWQINQDTLESILDLWRKKEHSVEQQCVYSGVTQKNNKLAQRRATEKEKERRRQERELKQLEKKERLAQIQAKKKEETQLSKKNKEHKEEKIRKMSVKQFIAHMDRQYASFETMVHYFWPKPYVRVSWRDITHVLEIRVPFQFHKFTEIYGYSFHTLENVMWQYGAKEGLDRLKYDIL